MQNILPRFRLSPLIASLAVVASLGVALRFYSETTSAREYDGPPPQTRKADRLAIAVSIPGMYAERIDQIWSGTEQNAEERVITASISNKQVLAYAPATDATPAQKALEVVDQKKTAKLVPLPPIKPRNLGITTLAAGAPVSLLGTLKEPAPQKENFQLASLGSSPVKSDVEKASLPGVTLPSPFGIPYRLQTESVKAGCFPPALLSLLGKIEQNYRTKVVVTSGLRNYGRSGSLHRTCQAADIIVPGVSGAELAAYAKTLPGIGGVGRYCHPFMIHVDVGTPREWKYGCGSYFALRKA